MHEFGQKLYDGRFPYAMVIKNSSLYGVCAGGGTRFDGSIFKMNTDGTGYSVLHNFSDVKEDGLFPAGSLLPCSTFLYGVTGNGGAFGRGTLYKINLDGDGYEIVYSFGSVDGSSYPVESLTSAGSRLFGMALGQQAGKGTVYSINRDGTGFELLHTFMGSPDGYNPVGSLLVWNSTLVGQTSYGGSFTNGASAVGGGLIYAIDTQLNNYRAIRSFGELSDGSWPVGCIAASNRTLYGMNRLGGSNGCGIIYSLHLVSMSLQSNPRRGGFLSDGGTFVGGSTQMISAVAHRGWAFTGWADGDTNSVRTVVLPTNDMTYTANFVITGFVAAVQGDFEGDAKADIATFYPAGGAWNVLKSSGGSAAVQLGYSPDIPVAADYDGDGKVDYAIFDPPTGNWFIKQSSNGTFTARNWGYFRTLPVPADYDGDGRADIAVYDPPVGMWYILRSSDGGMVQQQWGWSKAIPVPADYDGDGKADIATYVPSTGQWNILQSANGQLLQINWGWNQAMPVPADYDGDGKADIATYVPASGQWSIRRSSDGGLTQQSWGWSQAAPVPADYDGDGRADMATYYPAGGQWNVLKSGGGMIAQNWGWSQAAPVLPQFQINRKYFPAP